LLNFFPVPADEAVAITGIPKNNPIDSPTKGQRYIGNYNCGEQSGGYASNFDAAIIASPNQSDLYDHEACLVTPHASKITFLQRYGLLFVAVSYHSFGAMNIANANCSTATIKDCP